MLTYFDIRKSLIIKSLSIAAIVSLLYAFLVIFFRVVYTRQFNEVFSKIVSSTKKFIGLGLFVIILMSGINIAFSSGIMKSEVPPTKAQDIEKQSMAHNMKILVKLHKNNWHSLTAQERLDVLQVVANIEQGKLGLPYELNVTSANLQDRLLGSYNDKSREIIINMNSLLYAEPYMLLDTLCHEAYHSYQYRMADAFKAADDSVKKLKMFQKAAIYAHELENYKNSEKNFCEYYHQDCEEDAREYAERAVFLYNASIYGYLKHEEEK